MQERLGSDNLEHMVGQAVGLVGQIAAVAQALGPAGDQAQARYAGLVERFQGLIIRRGEKSGEYVALFNECRNLINPVQSRLQDRVHPNPGALASAPMSAAQGAIMRDLLDRIIRAKGDWAVFDRAPQMIFRHSDDGRTRILSSVH